MKNIFEPPDLPALVELRRILEDPSLASDILDLTQLAECWSSAVGDVALVLLLMLPGRVSMAGLSA